MIDFLLGLQLKNDSLDGLQKTIVYKNEKPTYKKKDIWLFRAENIFGYHGEVYIDDRFDEYLFEGSKRKVETILFHNRLEAIEFIIEIDNLCRKCSEIQGDYYVIDAKTTYNSKSKVLKRLLENDYLMKIWIHAPGLDTCMIPKIYGHKGEMTTIFVDRFTIDFCFLGLQTQLQKEKNAEYFAEIFY